MRRYGGKGWKGTGPGGGKGGLTDEDAYFTEETPAAEGADTAFRGYPQGEYGYPAAAAGTPQQAVPPTGSDDADDDDFAAYMKEMKAAAAKTDTDPDGRPRAKYDPEELKEKDAVSCFLEHREKHEAYGRFHISSRDDEQAVRATTAQAEQRQHQHPPQPTGLAVAFARAGAPAGAPTSVVRPPINRKIYDLPEVVAARDAREPNWVERYNATHGVSVKMTSNRIAGISYGGSASPAAAAAGTGDDAHASPSLRPVLSWSHLGLPRAVISKLEEKELTEPTVIQTYTIPAALLGMDVVAYARTGAGKTLGYLLPLCAHVRAQAGCPFGKQRGPGGVVVLPTRELAQQVYQELREVAKAWDLTPIPFYGGMDKTQQFQEARRGFDVGVLTPGRALDLVNDKCFALHDCTMLVIDECDVLCSMGFAAEVGSLIEKIRPDRKFMLLSATQGAGVAKMVKSLTQGTGPTATPSLRAPLVTIEVGNRGENAAVTQRVEVVDSAAGKWEKLWTVVFAEAARGGVLVFANSADCCESIDAYLAAAEGMGINTAVVHGQKDQVDRTRALDSFRDTTTNVLIATDVASRGLNIPSVKSVISFDCAKDIDTHVHRIGRAGRGLGVDDGVAITFFNMDYDYTRPMARHLVAHLRQNMQAIPEELMKLLPPPSPQPSSAGGAGGSYARRSGMAPPPVAGVPQATSGAPSSSSLDAAALEGNDRSHAAVPHAVADVNPLMYGVGERSRGGAAPPPTVVAAPAASAATSTPAPQPAATPYRGFLRSSDAVGAGGGDADAASPTPAPAHPTAGDGALLLPRGSGYSIELPPAPVAANALGSADSGLPPRTAARVTIDLPPDAKEAPKVKMFGNRRLHEPLVGSLAAQQRAAAAAAALQMAQAAPAMPIYTPAQAHPPGTHPPANASMAAYQQSLVQQQQQQQVWMGGGGGGGSRWGTIGDAPAERDGRDGRRRRRRRSSSADSSDSGGSSGSHGRSRRRREKDKKDKKRRRRRSTSSSPPREQPDASERARRWERM